MKKLFLLIFFFLTIYESLASINIASASGVENYTPLAPIGKFIQAGTVNTTNLTDYLNKMFQLGIAIAGALAVVMIIVGGIQYMSTDAIGGKAEGKSRITAAITGLIVALGSYMLLNTISPDLLKTDLGLQPVSVAALSGIRPGDPGYPYGSYDPQHYGSTYYGDPAANGPLGPLNYDGTNPRLDTDGGTTSLYDPTHQNVTALGGLNAETDPYIVVNDRSQLGQYFLVTDENTGQSIVAVGGDIGHGFGEISTATARGIGMQVTGDSLPDHHITISPYTGPPPGK